MYYLIQYSNYNPDVYNKEKDMKKIFIKSILVLSSLFFCLTSCIKEKIPYFDSINDAIRFNNTKEYDEETNIYKGSYSFLENPFAEYGEYDLPLVLVGNVSPEDRLVEYRIDEEQSNAPEKSYEIVSAMIPANSLKGVIKIKMHNTDEIQDGASYSIYIQLKASPALRLGPKEYITATVSWSSDVVPPAATDRYIWMTYNSLIKSSLPPTSTSTTAYSSNAIKAIIAALDWNDWDDMAAHPDQLQTQSYYTYKYLANYRFFVTDKAYEAYAAKLADYLVKYNEEHPDSPLIHNEGSMQDRVLEARTY